MENRSNCCTKPIPIYWPSKWLHSYTIHSRCHYQAWLTGLLSGASFSNPVNLLLRQWDPWKAPHGRYGSELHPSDSEMSPRPSKHVWAYGWHFLDSYIASPNSPNRGFNLPPAVHPPPPPTPSPSHPPPIMCHL